ncbi:DUF393-like protein [Fragilaria crotonensis]|nr:DUF393-like protein [Fragilaria crotonensis]
MKSTTVLVMSLLAVATTGAAGFVPCPIQATDLYYNYMPPSATITAAASNRGARPLKVSLSAPNTAAFSSQHVGWDWNSLANGAFEKDQRPVILFDGVCNLCNGGVNFALDHDSKANFRFASMQSKIGQSLLLHVGRSPQDMSSIVVIESDWKHWSESDAILRISQGLDGPLFVGLGHLGFLIPRIVRDELYHVVSHNRYRFGERDSCRVDFDGEFDDRFVKDPEGLA